MRTEKSAFKKLCVFCGSNVGAQPAFADAARGLAAALVTAMQFLAPVYRNMIIVKQKPPGVIAGIFRLSAR